MYSISLSTEVPGEHINLQEVGLGNKGFPSIVGREIIESDAVVFLLKLQASCANNFVCRNTLLKLKHGSIGRQEQKEFLEQHLLRAVDESHPSVANGVEPDDI